MGGTQRRRRRAAAGTGRRGRSLRAIWAPSLVRRVLRRRAAWWALAAILAVIGTLQVQSQRASLVAARAEWGATEPVLVVDRPVAVGEPLLGAVSPHELPVAMIPEQAARRLPAGSVAKVALHRGEVLVAGRITGGDDRGIPDGFVALSMQLLGDAPLVEPGDLVDVWVVDSASGTSRRVGARLLVLDRSDDGVTVALPAHQAGSAAVAALRPVTLVLVG